MTIKIIVPLLMFCMSLVGCTSGSKHDTGRKAVIEQAQSIAQTMNAAQNSQNVSTWSNQEDASLVDESQEGSKTTRHRIYSCCGAFWF